MLFADMDYLDLFAKVGFPIGVLIVFAIAVWRVLVGVGSWAKTKVDEWGHPLVAKHIELINKNIETLSDMKSAARKQAEHSVRATEAMIRMEDHLIRQGELLSKHVHEASDYIRESRIRESQRGKFLKPSDLKEGEGNTSRDHK